MLSNYVQCWAVLSNIMQLWAFYAVLSAVFFCSVERFYAVLCTLQQFYAVLSSVEKFCAVLSSVEQFYGVLCSIEQFYAVLCSLVHFNAWNKIKGFQFSDNLFLRLEVYKGARGLFGFTSPLKRKSVNIIVLIFKRRNRTEFCTINWMHSYPDVA